MPAKKPLCGECVEGWIVDPDTFLPVRRCPCRFDVDPAAGRDVALGATADANPDAMKAALRIIRETALSTPVFSSNDTRHRMKLAQVPGPTVGAAFQQAAKDRVIVRLGYVASTDLGTHAHPVVEWESRIYRKASA